MARGQKRTARNTKKVAIDDSHLKTKTKSPTKNLERRRSQSSEPKSSTLSDQQPCTPVPETNLASPIISPRTELMHDMQNRFNIDNEGPNKKIKTEMEVDTDHASDVPLGLLEMFQTLEAGRVLCVGQGSTGQLGNGPDMIERKKPFPVKSLAEVDVKIISAGGMHCACITADHSIYTWGCNDEGALGRYCQDDEEETYPHKITLPDGAGKPVNVTCGDSHTAILDEFGNVYVCGNFRDGSGQLGLVDLKSKSVLPVKMTLQEPVIKISSGADHLLILGKNGVAYTFGSGGVGQLGRGGRYFSDRGGRRGASFVLKPAPVRFSIQKRNRGLSLGEDRSRNVSNTSKKSDLENTVVGTIGTPSHGKNRHHVENIFACGLASFIISKQQVYTFGLNNYSQLGHHDKENRFVPTYSKEFSSKTWLEIVGGEHHAIGITTDSEVYSIGRGDYGQLGVVDKDAKIFEQTEQLNLVKFPDNDKIPVSISSSVGCCYVVTSDGKGYAWGLGTNLQLTTGEDEDENLPVDIQGGRLDGKRILKSSLGGQHGMFLVSV